MIVSGVLSDKISETYSILLVVKGYLWYLRSYSEDISLYKVVYCLISLSMQHSFATG